MGALGPRRVEFGPEGETLPPPGSLVDNEYSWLDVTDLVFIDPVSTGFSRPAEGQDAKQFHGVEQDISSVGDFIRLFTTRYERWLSPKFLAGESYGTTRAAGLSGYLQQRHGMYLNGIVLVSSVLNFQTIVFNDGNETPFWLFLPSYTATAWYHKKLAPDLQADLKKTLAEVEKWASTDYLLALVRGNTLTEAERKAVAQRLARYTGLSEQFVLDTDLRININHFTKELLRDQGLTVGRFDSRYTGRDRDNVESRYERDPSYSAVQGAFTAGFNDYVRRELQYMNDKSYEILTGRVRPWDYGNAQNSYLNVAETLREAISQNPSLQVLFASGRYDLATPYYAADYTITQLGLPLTYQPNISHAYYDAGHMMYTREADLAKLKSDVAAFITRALQGR
jgi:carboxypeptidase C (cathepsin A)